jgi:hypothetical protein
MESFTTRNIGRVALRVKGGRSSARFAWRWPARCVVVFFLAACAADRPPLVTETEQPWQLEYEAQAGLGPTSPRAQKAKSPRQIVQHGVESPEPEKGEGERLAGVFADVIAFPFRGLGWVVQKIF